MEEGTILKSWKVGKKLGSGACSDVYAVEPIKPLVSCKCQAFVVKVSPLLAPPAGKDKNKKRKKSAAERNADALYAEHLIYQSHLREHPGLPYIPAGAYGEDKGYRFLVMERLGRTLEAVLREHGPLPSPVTAQLCLDILKTLQYIHSKNIVYVDVKPENFMLDMEHESQVYCVDFGISDRFIAATGKHKEHKAGSVVGTPTFLSLNCHKGGSASRRDDLEALLNVMLYMMHGRLPWQDAKSDAEGAKVKEETTIDVLCKGLPSQWAAMMKAIRSTAYDEKPDYALYERCLAELGAVANSTAPYKWGHKVGMPKSVLHSATVRGTASPVKKKTRKEVETAADVDGEELSEEEVAARAVKPKRTVSKAPKKAAPRKTTRGTKPMDGRVRSPSPKMPPTATTAAVASADGEAASEARDPHRRRKAAAKAVAAAAAASAAAKHAEGTGRYNLRRKQHPA